MMDISGCLAGLFFVVAVGIMFWYANQGGSYGIEQKLKDREKRNDEKRQFIPLRKPGEENLPEWVVKARRDIERNQRQVK